MDKETKFEKTPFTNQDRSDNDSLECGRGPSVIDSSQSLSAEKSLPVHLDDCHLSPMVDVGGILMPRRQAIVLGFINPNDIN